MLEKRKKQNQETITVADFMNSMFSGNASTTPDLFDEEIPHRRRSETGLEYVVQVRVSGGTIVQLKTGRFSHKAALREVPFAIKYCKENYGPVLAWNWLGEENVLRTPHSSFTRKDRSLKEKVVDLKEKVVDYFFGLDEDE